MQNTPDRVKLESYKGLELQTLYKTLLVDSLTMTSAENVRRAMENARDEFDEEVTSQTGLSS